MSFEKKSRGSRRRGFGRASAGTKSGVSETQNERYPVMSPNKKNIGGFPSEVRVSLKYVTTFTLDAPSGSLAAQEFSMRGMFDPDVTGTGHQPSNFDRWMTIFNAYTVLRTHVKLSPAWNSTSSVQPCYWGFLVSKSGSQVTGFSGVEYIMEQPFVRYADTGAGISNGAANAFPGSLTAALPSGPWLGVNNSVLRSQDYHGDVGANPAAAEDFRLECFAGAMAGNDPGAVPFKCEIVYDAVFMLPKITLPS
jgi:hypothetical protein